MIQRCYEEIHINQSIYLTQERGTYRIADIFRGYKCSRFSLINLILHAAKGCYSAKIFLKVFPRKYTRYTAFNEMWLNNNYHLINGHNDGILCAYNVCLDNVVYKWITNLMECLIGTLNRINNPSAK